MKEGQRDKILYKNTILNYGCKTIYYIFSFLAVPLALNFLGKERFGIFQTILTFISWAMLANLGIGNGLRNKISEYIGNNKSNELKGIIGSAFSISLSISIILLLIGFFFFWFVFDPLWLFSNIKISPYEIKLTFLISFVFFCFNLFFSLFSSIAYGIHKSYIPTLVQVIQYGLYCLFLYILIKSETVSSLIFVSIVYGLSMIFSQSIPVFIISRKSELWPPDFRKRKQYYKELLTMSLGFFVLQLSSIVLFSSA
jgi:O-antigen/teichoic acid export membrane protein